MLSEYIFQQNIKIEFMKKGLEIVLFFMKKEYLKVFGLSKCFGEIFLKSNNFKSVVFRKSVENIDSKKCGEWIFGKVFKIKLASKR